MNDGSYKIKVYIAAPYTIGDPAMNTNAALVVADKLLELGYIPMVPHLTHFWHEISSKPWEQWMEIGRALLAGCDALLRLPGPSKGADLEIEYAKALGIPVCYEIEELGDVKQNLFNAAHAICVERAGEYDQGSISRDDYWLYGEKSLIHELWKKILRLRSLEAVGRRDKFGDSLIDLVNYASFLWMLDKKV